MGLESFLMPQSIAVIGASRDPAKVGHQLVANLIADGYPGTIFPINPGAAEVAGLKCHPSLTAAGTPDLALIAVPAPEVPKVIQQCADAGVKAAIIISAGFEESGEAGARLQQEVTRIASMHGLRVVGPNSVGIMVPGRKLNAGIGGRLAPPGSIGYISQSGAILVAVIDVANTDRLGFSILAGIGNKADVDELDMIRALGEDPQTHVIAGYLESIRSGNSFVREVEQISHRKPILLLKAGSTAAGARATVLHTGVQMGDEVIYESIFERAGVVRCDSLKMQLDCARAFATQPLPRGPNVAVLTNAGGAGIMAADALERIGLACPQVEAATMARLRDGLLSGANVDNPIYLKSEATPRHYELALRAAMEDPNIHTVLALLAPQAATRVEETAQTLVRIHQEGHNKPLLACFMGASRIHRAIPILRDGQVPSYDSPESAVHAINAMVEYARWKDRPERIVKLFPVNRHSVDRIVERHLRWKLAQVGETEAKDVLEAYGFATPRGELATTSEQAANIADQLGYPVVLKVWSADIVRKSAVGGVKLGLQNRQQVMDAFDLMMYRIPQKAPKAQIMGVLVQEMITGAREVVLGMRRDPRFGPLMMFGMGGIFVEVLKDVAFHLAPLTAEEARQMLLSTRTYHLLRGATDEQEVDIDAIAEALQRLSQLVTEFPQIEKMEINPLAVGPPGTRPIAIDARIEMAATKEQ